MAKFYIKSGEVTDIVDAMHEFEAIGIAIANAPPEALLGSLIWVNEQGFDNVNHETDVFVDTESFLRNVCDYECEDD